MDKDTDVITTTKEALRAKLEAVFEQGFDAGIDYGRGSGSGIYDEELEFSNPYTAENCDLSRLTLLDPYCG